MNKISIEILDIKNNVVIKKSEYFFKVKDAALIFINSQLDAFTSQYGAVINSVTLEDYHIYQATETHEIVIETKWGKA